MEALATATTSRRSSISSCTARFQGSRNDQKVQDFITKTSVFKKLENISDADAITGLPLLLEGEASTWWKLVEKADNLTWTQAVEMIRKKFSARKPAYRVYMEIFEDFQKQGELTDIFISRKQALFPQLPKPTLPKSIKLDIVYGLLHQDIKKEVQREKMNSFDELLQMAQTVETKLLGKKAQNKEMGKNRGHAVTDCRIKKKNDEQKVSKTENLSKNTSSVSCYGCGAPGVFRSNCQTCKKDKDTKKESVKFCAASLRIGQDIPTITASIHGIKGLVHMDTGARTSIASDTLFKHLVALKCNFTKSEAEVTLADGSVRNRKILATTVPISIEGEEKMVKLHYLNQSHNNRTLLGMDFLENTGVVINAAALK